MPTELPENVECSVPGTCNDCHAMVFFLLTMIKWVCSHYTEGKVTTCLMMMNGFAWTIQTDGRVAIHSKKHSVLT